MISPVPIWHHKKLLEHYYYFLKILFIYFLERGEGKKKERERTISVWLPLKCPQLGTWPGTQACALTRNRASNALVCGPVLNPLSYTSQGLLGQYWLYSVCCNLHPHDSFYNWQLVVFNSHSLFSPIFPPTLPPRSGSHQFVLSMGLFLFCLFIMYFLDSMCKLNRMVFVFLCLIYIT